jgi:hypothetical protein
MSIQPSISNATSGRRSGQGEDGGQSLLCFVEVGLLEVCLLSLAPAPVQAQVGTPMVYH